MQSTPINSTFRLQWLLVDMNSFFASCEQQDNPELRGQPVGVVPMMADNTSILAASYEAKAFGIKTGTKVFEAKKLCPNIKLVCGGHKKYVHYHHKILEAIEKVCPIKKTLSIDEVACELIGREQIFENAIAIAQNIKNKILEDVGECLTTSIGLGPNIMIAKIASDLKKPNGLIAIPKEQIPEKLGHLDVSVISGVGRQMKYHLNSKGIYKINDILRLSSMEFRNLWGGIVGTRLYLELKGESYQRPETQSSSLSHQHVLPPHLRQLPEAYKVVIKLLFKGCTRLRDSKKKTQGLYFKIKFLDNTKIEKHFRFKSSDDSFFMAHLIKDYLKEHKDEINRKRSKPIKVGIALTDLTIESTEQMSFFDEPRKNKLNQVMDIINERFGSNTLVSGVYLDIVHEAKTKIAFSNIPDLEDEFD